MGKEDVHKHIADDGTEYTHSHYEEGHKHVHKNTKVVVNRLSRAIGHLESVKHMVEDGRDCSEVLVQLAAVRAALNNTGKEILKQHISHCIVEAVDEGDTGAIDELNLAIDKFMK